MRAVDRVPEDAWALDFDLPGMAGFRLWGVELLNWGTFDGHVVRLPVEGHNTFVTGNVGAGKSTIVDALTTLFVPSHRVVYNQAAGAGRNERRLETYLRGTYTTAADDGGSASRPVSLRGSGHVSVVLARFRDDLAGTDCTFAQVFYFTGSGTVEKVYAVADEAVGIEELVSGAGSRITRLRAGIRRRMTEQPTWREYIAAVRKRLGLKHDKALALWAQTVSMKQVGNLTAFVRAHMLEPPDATNAAIGRLVEHYQDLVAAFDAIALAKAKLGVLDPLVRDLAERDRALAAAADWIRLRDDRLVPYYQHREIEAIEGEAARATQQLAEARDRKDAVDRRAAAALAQVQTLDQAIRDSGGEALERLAEQRDRAEDVVRDRSERFARYATRCDDVGVAPARTIEEFTAVRSRLAAIRDEAAATAAEETAYRLFAERRELSARIEEASREIEVLSRRTSNIDSRLLEVRAGLASAVGVDETDLPFAGELLQVRADHREWEPAIQRLLRGFGLSLLVPERHYAAIVRLVDTTDLRARLVYYRVGADPRPARRPAPGTVPRALDVLPTSPLRDWVAAEVARRFDYDLADRASLAAAEQAVTRNGQVKHRGQRHEKDDRTPLGDRSRYVLGWDNLDKVGALRERVAQWQDEESAVSQRFERAEESRQRAQRIVGGVDALLLDYPDFTGIDVATAAEAHDALVRQWEELRSQSTTLDALVRTREQHQQDLERLRVTSEEWSQRIGRHDGRIADLRERREQLPEDPEPIPDDDRAVLDRLHEAARQSVGALTTRTVDALRTAVREAVQAEIDKHDKRAGRARDRILPAMKEFTTRHPEDSADLDATLESADEFRRVHARLVEDDLPRFEDAFRTQLSDNAIREMAGFNRHLADAADRIGDHVERINSALADIPYTPTTYIRLEATRSLDADVRDFRRDLRECIEGSLGEDDDAFTVERFERVRALMERFRGRPGRVDEDRRWTARVTDVNNWYTFAIVERDRGSDEPVAHYSDSDGKSGGEKEKLAYTILAAALAYNFGLVAGDPRSRTFRFVAIDEAFARGSDSSTRFALDLFEKMGLQLLIVTPLQKKEVIAPYVRRVALVTQDESRRSHVIAMSVEEYRDRVAAVTAASANTASVTAASADAPP